MPATTSPMIFTPTAHTNLLVKTEKEGTGYSVLLTNKEGQRTALVYRGAAGSTGGSTTSLGASSTPKWIYLSSVKGNLPLISASSNMPPTTILPLHGIRAAKRFVTVCKPSPSPHPWLRHLAPQPRGGRHPFRIGAIRPPRYAPRPARRGASLPRPSPTAHAAPMPPRVTPSSAPLPTDVPTINVTGAGDAFGAGFVAGIMSKESLTVGLQVWDAQRRA